MTSDSDVTPDWPDWEKRFRAPRVGLPDWAEDAPDRALFVSNATGTFELYAWDRATGGQRQATDRPNGTTDGTLSPDGEWIWWFSDTDGDEFGTWVRQPFAGGPDEPATPGLEPSYPAGLAIGRDGTA
ncbi:TolB family protein, partial [Streptomyces goshikiensis]